MKSRSFAVIVFSILLLGIALNPALARGKRKATSPARHETLISSVNPTAVTIIEDKVARTFTITQFTEINVNGQKATVADLNPGMIVSVTIGTDPTRASRIV